MMQRLWRTVLFMMLSACLCVVAGVCSAPSAKGEVEGTAGAELKPREIGPNRYQLGSTVIDTDRRTVSCPGTVNIRQGGPIELLACTQAGKVHESILVLECRPIEVQLALLLLGVEPGRNPAVDYANGPGWDQLPTATLLGITVQWEEPATDEKPARLVSCPAEELLYNVKTGGVQGAARWAFTGSRWVEGRFGAEVTGSIIVTYHDPLGVIELAEEEVNDDTYFNANEELLPEVGATVTVVIQVPADAESDAGEQGEDGSGPQEDTKG